MVGCLASLSTSSRPMLGNQPSLTAKIHFRISPRKKIGIEIPISEPTRLTWSKMLP